MEGYTDPAVIIPILLSGIFTLLYFVWRYWDKKYPRRQRGAVADVDVDVSNTEVPKYPSVLAVVFDNTDRLSPLVFEDVTIDGFEVEKIILRSNHLGSQLKLPSGKKGFPLVKNDDGYDLVEEIELSPDSPIRLNNDTEHGAFAILLKRVLTKEGSFMQKYGQVLWWAAVIGFIIFMMVSG